MTADIFTKLIRETNVHFRLSMTENKPAEVELNSSIHLSRIFLVRESGKKCPVSSTDNSVPHIIIIKNIKADVAVTKKLTPVANHKRRSPIISFKYLLPCSNFIFAKLAKETKDFLKIRNDFINHKRNINPQEKTDIINLGVEPYTVAFMLSSPPPWELFLANKRGGLKAQFLGRTELLLKKLRGT